MKHKIIADTHGHFIRNIETLKEQLDSAGKIIRKMKIKMKTHNSDYDSYNRNYVGIFWSENR